jgi:hypothetical protein
MKYTIVAPGVIRGRGVDGLWTLVKGDPEDADSWVHVVETGNTREGLIKSIKSLRDRLHEESLNLLHEADALLEFLTTAEEEVCMKIR